MRALANTFGLSIILSLLLFFFIWITESISDATYTLVLGGSTILFISLIINIVFALFTTRLTNSTIWTEIMLAFSITLITITAYVSISDDIINWIDYLTQTIVLSLASTLILVPLNRWTKKRI